MGKAAQTIHIIITYRPFGVVISLMISDTDYFYIWQLFTFIFFLFQASGKLFHDFHWRRTKVETTGAIQDYETLISRLFETFLYF